MKTKSSVAKSNLLDFLVKNPETIFSALGMDVNGNYRSQINS
jgi:hypothetical protein